jgi:hypothetical protein
MCCNSYLHSAGLGTIVTGRECRVVYRTPRRTVDLSVWIRSFRIVSHQFGDCVFSIRAVVGIVGIKTGRVIGKLSPISGDRDTFSNQHFRAMHGCFMMYLLAIDHCKDGRSQEKGQRRRDP